MYESASLPPKKPAEKKEPQKKYRIGIVENSEQLETAAHDVGDAKMTASKEELRGIGGFFKKIWKHNLFNEVYRQKEITKARTAIKESGNVYIGEGGDAKHHALANQAIVERFVSEYDETVHKEAGEKRETLGNTEAEKAIQVKIRKLVIDYATSKETPNDEVFQAEKIRIFNELKGVKKDVIDKGDLYADNVLEIAKQIRQNIDHNKGCADLDIDFEVVVGKAKAGARTEAQFNAVDRITEKIHKSPVGRFVNEATVTTAVAIAYNLGIAASQRIASSKLAAWGTFGATALLGGGIAAARESRKLEVERKQHFREMAQGKSFDPSKAERREEMEKSRYETRDATSLIQGLEQSLYTTDKNGIQKLKVLDQAGAENVLKQLAEIESRIKLSDTQKIDLISYSDVKNIEGERLALDLARAKAKVDIRKITKGNSADTYLAKLQGEKIKELTKGDRGIEEKNALFQAMKKKKVAMAAFKGVATGLVVGAAAQEIISFLNDQQHGLIEGLVNPGSKAAGANPQHLTSLEFVRRYFSGELPPGGGSGATVSPKEFLAAHSDGTERIRRLLWYDNDTPKPIFDKNELKLWWGGKSGTGIDAQGNYVFNMKHMLPDGSYHKNFSADAQDLMQSGKLKMLFSLSKDTQNQVFEIPIDAKGNAIIDPNSEIGKMLFQQNAKGHAEFLGKYAEVAQAMGNKDGSEQVRILATHVGKGVSEVELPSAPYIIDQPIIPVFGRKPLEKTEHPAPSPEHGPYYSGRGKEAKQKTQYTEVSSYRNSEDSLRKLIDEKLRSDKEKSKYEKLLQRIEELENFSKLTPAQQQKYSGETETSNHRYKRNDSVSEYVSQARERVFRQVENTLLEEAKVGETPFAPEFYKNSPLVKGLERANEVTVILDDPLGDAILTIPVITSLYEYFKQNGQQKKITVFTSLPGLFNNLEKQFPGFVSVVDLKNAPAYFAQDPNAKRFIINAHKEFGDPQTFGLTDKEYNDLSRVMSVDYASWTKEEVTLPNGRIKKYDPMPARIMRNFEIMLGQKLFSDINAMDHFIDQDADFDVKSEKLKKKYNIKEDEKLIVISAGSSVTPKEYSPARWEEVMNGIFSQYDSVHILFLDDPRPEKKAIYGKMVDELVSQKKYNISRVSAGLNDMNTIMSMADVSITPDTGLGHLSGAVGTPNIMLTLTDPVAWSTANTIRIMHPKAIETYKLQQGVYTKVWDNPNEYFVEDDGEQIGASNIKPEKVIEQVKNVLGKKGTRSKKEVQKTVAEYLSYAGVDHASVKENAKRIEGGKIKINERKYAAALLDAFKERPQGEVPRLVGKMRTDFDELIGKFGFIKNQNPFSRNDTWIYWDIAKQYYLNGHPKESGAGYTVNNPLENQSKQEEIVNRHFGWELHANRKNLLADAEFVAKFLSSTQGKKLKKLLDKPPKANGTLSSKDLALLGKYVREQIA